jgi:DNA processing protein
MDAASERPYHTCYFILSTCYLLPMSPDLRYQWLIYSLDPSLNISKLKSWEYSLDIDTWAIDQRCQDQWIQVIVEGMSDYHHRFHQVSARPYILYALGDLSVLHKPLLWIVWPRQMSPYGERIVDDIIQHAQEYDLATISWLAPWVDWTTHTRSIEQGIPTVAILWWGLQYFLSQWTQGSLIQQIVAAWWLVLSEFKLKQTPTTYTFPQRNRLIAWLSQILLVPEAGKQSGSLITVDDAIKAWKPVYGFPNSIYTPHSEWVLEYLSTWRIKCAWSISLILSDHFQLKQSASHNIQKASINLTPRQQTIINQLQWQGPLSIEMIIQLTWIDQISLLTELSMLELDNIVIQAVPNHYQLV